MAYNANIPQPTDLLSVSQNDIQNNFSSSNTSFGIDHYPFNDGTALNGIHKKVTLTDSVAPGFAPGTGALYASLINGQSWPTWQNALGSTTLISGPTLPAITGYTYLAGNILLQWGENATTGTVTTISFPKTFSAIFQVVAISNSAVDTDAVANFTTSNFKYANSGGAGKTAHWFAIGTGT